MKIKITKISIEVSVTINELFTIKKSSEDVIIPG